MLDMATATVAVGKLEVAAVNNQQIPGGWAVDGRGRQTQARAFTRQGHLVTVHTCHVSRVTVTRGSEVKVLAAVSPHRAAGGGGAAAGGRGGVRRLQGLRPGSHGGGSACHVTSCHVT